jgi:TM2 domain-containing membrane protein YozV
MVKVCSPTAQPGLPISAMALPKVCCTLHKTKILFYGCSQGGYVPDVKLKIFWRPALTVYKRNAEPRRHDNRYMAVQTAELRDPVIMLIISILVGTFGVDRFLVGDTGLGIAKLLTCGGFGIWTIVDWFLIMDRTKEANLQQVQRRLV